MWEFSLELLSSLSSSSHLLFSGNWSIPHVLTWKWKGCPSTTSRQHFWSPPLCNPPVRPSFSSRTSHSTSPHSKQRWYSKADTGTPWGGQISKSRSWSGSVFWKHLVSRRTTFHSPFASRFVKKESITVFLTMLYFTVQRSGRTSFSRPRPRTRPDMVITSRSRRGVRLSPQNFRDRDRDQDFFP